MEYKNSYIFIRKDKPTKQQKNNKLIIDIPPSFKELLEKTFKYITFDFDDEGIDIMNSGSIEIKINNKKRQAFFKYRHGGDNIYFDIIVNSNNSLTALSILQNINTSLISKGSVFDKEYISVISYDYISEYYCNKLYPYLNEFDRKLRKILLNIYTLNFNLNYYSATTNDEFQKNLKQGSIQIKKELDKYEISNMANSDCYIKYGFYTLEYSAIDEMLFTETVTDLEKKKITNFLSQNKNLSEISDKELRKNIKMCIPKTDWERLFEDEKDNIDFKTIFNKIRIFRNNIAHCKLVGKPQYENYLELLKTTTSSLDKFITITEKQKFIDKSIALRYESSEKMVRIMSEAVLNICKPLIENIDSILPHMTESKALSAVAASLTANMPNIVLPEIELSKFNLVDYFNLNDSDKK